MNSDSIVAHFERIANAPYSISRLRKFILDLAVRGKLVDQNPLDQPAAELLKRIQKWKDQALAEKKVRLPRNPLAKIDSAEFPYSLPAGWAWSRLGEIIYINSGDGLTAESMFEGVVPVFGSNGITGYHNKANVYQSTVVIGRVGSCGSIHVTPSSAWITDNAFMTKFCSEAIYQDFLVLLLTATNLKKNEKATAQPVISGTKIYPIVIGLPPLAEQHRIVTKVNELMALCDRLEVAQAERESRRDRLAAASLQRLNQPADASTFRAHVSFHLNYIQRLTTRPEQIKQFRQIILNLAVRGQLVAQDSSDEPASALLDQMRVEKARQLNASERKTQQALPDISEREAPFQIPKLWRWARVDDCFNVSGGIQKTPSRTPKNNSHPYIGVGNVYRGRLDLSEIKQFELIEGELEKFRLLKGDILVVEGNGSANEIGRCALWSDEIKDCVHQNHIIRCRPFKIEPTPYVLLYLNSPYGIQVMKELAVTSSGLYNLSVGKIRAIFFPLPPLAEQHRIVVKVDELMSLCDRLEAQLTTTQTTSRRLLESVLHEALASA